MDLIRPTNVHLLPIYSPAARAGNTIYVSGQVAWDDNGKVVGEGDFEAQAKQVFQNIQKVLHAAGVSPQHVVKINCYLTNAADYPVYSEIRAKYFAGHASASTVVIVEALIQPELLLEVELIAVAGS